MLSLKRIMEIASEHSRHCCASGDICGDKHNVQVLSVAIQEALSENDDVYAPTKTKALRSRNGSRALSANAKPSSTSGGGKTRATTGRQTNGRGRK